MIFSQYFFLRQNGFLGSVHGGHKVPEGLFFQDGGLFSFEANEAIRANSKMNPELVNMESLLDRLTLDGKLV